MWLRTIRFVSNVLYARSFVQSFCSFSFLFSILFGLLVCLFVCLSNECSNEKYLDHNYGNVYCSLVFDKFVVHGGGAGGVLGSFAFSHTQHTYVRTFIFFSL